MELYYYFDFLDEYAVFKVPEDKFDQATMLIDEAYTEWVNVNDDNVTSQICSDYIVECLAEHDITVEALRFVKEQE